MKKDSPIAFVVGAVLTLAIMYLVLHTLLSFDYVYFVPGGVGIVFLWFNAWRISIQKQKKL